MPKPQYTPPTIQPGQQGWDADVQDGFDQIAQVFQAAPMPLPEHSGDESDLEATWPAANYQRCIVFVDHSTDGWTPFVSDGTTWKRVIIS